MDHSYNANEIAKSYQDFLASEDGNIFRNVVGKGIVSLITNTGPEETRKILDAGCGDGWLAGLLCQRFPLPASDVAKGIFDTPEIHACDAGEPLIEAAQQKYADIKFSVCDLNKPLPYQESYFDIVTASMVLHDVEDETSTLKNIAAVLKPGGKLIAAIVNPYYGYPIGEWKRGLWGRLLLRKPQLKLARGYNVLMGKGRPSFQWRPSLGSHFTPLSHHMNAAKQAGLVLSDLVDLQSKADSPTYNLTYQLYRFPIILLVEFTKQ